MRKSEEVASLIIRLFAEKGVAQGKQNGFKFAGATPNGAHVLRDSGAIWTIKKEQIVRAVEAVRQEPAIYDAGPARLKPYINERVQSPLWAMLRLLSLDKIVS